MAKDINYYVAAKGNKFVAIAERNGFTKTFSGEAELPAYQAVRDMFANANSSLGNVHIISDAVTMSDLNEVAKILQIPDWKWRKIFSISFETQKWDESSVLLKKARYLAAKG